MNILATFVVLNQRRTPLVKASLEAKLLSSFRL